MGSTPSGRLSQSRGRLALVSEEPDLNRRERYIQNLVGLENTLQNASTSIGSGSLTSLDSAQQNSNIHTVASEPSKTMPGSFRGGSSDDDDSDIEIIPPSKFHDNSRHVQKNTRYPAIQAGTMLDSRIDNFRDAGYTDLIFDPLDKLVRPRSPKGVAIDIRWGSDTAFSGGSYSGTDHESRNWSVRTWDEILRPEN
jgi:hypothetical protein